MLLGQQCRDRFGSQPAQAARCLGQSYHGRLPLGVVNGAEQGEGGRCRPGRCRPGRCRPGRYSDQPVNVGRELEPEVGFVWVEVGFVWVEVGFVWVEAGSSLVEGGCHLLGRRLGQVARGQEWEQGYDDFGRLEIWD